MSIAKAPIPDGNSAHYTLCFNQVVSSDPYETCTPAVRPELCVSGHQFANSAGSARVYLLINEDIYHWHAGRQAPECVRRRVFIFSPFQL